MPKLLQKFLLGAGVLAAGYKITDWAMRVKKKSDASEKLEMSIEHFKLKEFKSSGIIPDAAVYELKMKVINPSDTSFTISQPEIKVLITDKKGTDKQITRSNPRKNSYGAVEDDLIPAGESYLRFLLEIKIKDIAPFIPFDLLPYLWARMNGAKPSKTVKINYKLTEQDININIDETTEVKI